MIRDHDINYHDYDYDSVLESLALAYTENLAISPNFLARVREIGPA